VYEVELGVKGGPLIRTLLVLMARDKMPPQVVELNHLLEPLGKFSGRNGAPL